MSRAKPVTILKRARALLEEHWAKGHFYSDSNNSYCALGALNAVTSRAKDPYNAAHSENAYSDEIEREYLMPLVPKEKGFGSVISYNDYPTTTKEDVLALYDRAIQLAESKG